MMFPPLVLFHVDPLFSAGTATIIWMLGVLLLATTRLTALLHPLMGRSYYAICAIARPLGIFLIGFGWLAIAALPVAGADTVLSVNDLPPPPPGRHPVVFFLFWYAFLLGLLSVVTLGWRRSFLFRSASDGLETAGLYGICRHPQLLSAALMCALGSLTVPRYRVALLDAALFAAAVHLLTLIEEADLARSYGEAYGSYRERVPRWLPVPRDSRQLGYAVMLALPALLLTVGLSHLDLTRVVTRRPADAWRSRGSSPGAPATLQDAGGFNRGWLRRLERLDPPAPVTLSQSNDLGDWLASACLEGIRDRLAPFPAEPVSVAPPSSLGDVCDFQRYPHGAFYESEGGFNDGFSLCINGSLFSEQSALFQVSAARSAQIRAYAREVCTLSALARPDGFAVMAIGDLDADRSIHVMTIGCTGAPVRLVDDFTLGTEIVPPGAVAAMLGP